MIGDPADPYIRRWWLIPRNRWFNIYLHQILRPDDDRALHDHPWWNLSIILKGGYYEVLPHVGPTSHFVRWRAPGSFTFRRAEAAHRLDLPLFCEGREKWVYRSCWSLFITGPRIREWGFHCPKGWVLWTDFVDKTDTGSVGRGCGEQS